MGPFFYFLGAPMIFKTQKVYFSRLMQVYVGFLMLAACFLASYWSAGFETFLLPIGWRTVRIVRQRRRKMANTAPTTLSAILLSMYNYTPLVISGTDKNKQLTLLSKLALTGRNM
jgi:hypothetical protein